MINEAVVHLAEKIAGEAHQGQYRRGGVVSYIEHPKAVVDRVGADPEARVVAWLHDVLEDTEVTASGTFRKRHTFHLYRCDCFDD